MEVCVLSICDVIILKLAAELPVVAGEKKKSISFFRFIKGLWRIY